MIEQKFVERIAAEAHVRPEQVAASIRLFDKGATVPFMARYRKDVTGNLDEVKLEQIEDRNAYFIALSSRRDAVLENIAKQGQLTDELRAKIEACFDKTLLEDLYLPFKKQRRTKATMAREQGLEPLADFIWRQELGPQPLLEFASAFVNSQKAISSPEEALQGAQYILAERVAMHAEARALLRERLLEEGMVTSRATKNASGQKTKFEAYYEYSERLKEIPSHRLLAVLRGVRMGFLRMDLAIDDAKVVDALVRLFLLEAGSPFQELIRVVVEDAYKRLLRPAIENEVIGIARQAADEEAVRVFRENARNLLLASPAGPISVIGLDPGLRTGCKLAVIDRTGAYVESATVFPGDAGQAEAAEKMLLDLMDKHGVHAIAIGNGTGSREAARFVNGVLKKRGDRQDFTILVNEAGASVYSASKLARQEFPELDVTLRGAISIARRLQDPLAELVKVEPRNIGVGQYQHDVNQRGLREGLYKTVKSCVNQVGVDLNTASVELLRYVSGIQMGTAQNIVEFRTEHGGFSSRAQLTEVSGIGEKTFEQCAGFLRIPDAANPLDATAIHPEAYPVVEQAAECTGLALPEFIKNHAIIEKLDFAPFATETIAELTFQDIRAELLRPGRDPRTEFKVPAFLDGVDDVADLEEGMETEGVVTNVTDFGAFIDIGVHQDGLVHLSELANRFVRDPREVVKVGQIVKVKVTKVDKELSRISLSMKALTAAPRKPARAHRTAQDQPREPGKDRAPHRRAEAGDGRVRGRRDAGRQDRPRQSAKQRDKAARKRPPKTSRPASTHANSEEKINTLLADQLAALRDKFTR